MVADGSTLEKDKAMMYPKPQWVRKKRVIISPAQRQRLLERAGGRCERCGDPFDWRGPQIHHKRHRKMGGTLRIYEDFGLQVLCGTCHSLVHSVIEI